MIKANPPLDTKGEKLLKHTQQLLDELLAANTGTALAAAQPRLNAAIDELVKHRYSQIGATDPQGTKR